MLMSLEMQQSLDIVVHTRAETVDVGALGLEGVNCQRTSCGHLGIRITDMPEVFPEIYKSLQETSDDRCIILGGASEPDNVPCLDLSEACAVPVSRPEVVERAIKGTNEVAVAHGPGDDASNAGG